MKAHRILAAALLFAALAPIAAEAQEPDRVRIVTRGMLGIMTEGVPANDPNAQQRVIVRVVPGSAAEQAGLQRGDVIVLVDGRPATQERMNGFAPGETLMLRVQRDGTSRDMQVVVGERTGEYRMLTTDMLSDSVRGRISIIMDDVRAHADTFAVQIESFMMDSTGARYWRPSVTDSAGRFSIMFGDSGGVFQVNARGFDREHLDSVRAHVYRMSEELPRFFADSVNWHFDHESGPGIYRFESRNIPMGPDSVRIYRPAEVWANSFSFGTRAVAGAELSELNEGLAEYFGTENGVLVLNAREGTPAERAGIRPGDVIVRANGVTVGSIAELRGAIEVAARGTDVELRVLRRGQNLDVRLRRD